MLQEIEQRGELENTLVVVTSDNGMPFPRVKGQGYDHSNHLPLAMRWGDRIANPGRAIDDFVSFIDIAPTFLDASRIDWKDTGMASFAGRSLMDIVESNDDGIIDPTRDRVLIGKEKHDIGRPGNVGYPIRGIVTERFLYLKNFKPERWPVGNPETGYLNCDGSPTKTQILELRSNPESAHFWQLSFGKRPPEEFYDLQADPDCMNNLANDPAFEANIAVLRERMLEELEQQGDPRLVGDNPDIFDTYPIFKEKWENFYERFLAGQAEDPAWANRSDVDTSIVD